MGAVRRILTARLRRRWVTSVHVMAGGRLRAVAQRCGHLDDHRLPPRCRRVRGLGTSGPTERTGAGDWVAAPTLPGLSCHAPVRPAYRARKVAAIRRYFDNCADSVSATWT